MLVDPSVYSTVDTLRDGRRLNVRAFRSSDQSDLVEAVSRTSPESLYRRFFTPKSYFSTKEKAFFLNPDFVNHVALVALIDEGGRPVIVGAGRYVLVQSGKAEVAFTVIDQYQGLGVGTILMRHLISLARAAALKELFAEVLLENVPMLKVFERSGLSMTTTVKAGIVHVALALA